MRLTVQQFHTLRLLSERPETVYGLANKLHNFYSYTPSWSRVHKVLRRLENRELVRRVDFEPLTVWQVTAAGRKAVGRA
jgi:DNA-binding PadR family transcriptional regulator